MEEIHNIRPNQRHYTCVGSMLSRACCLHEAEEFIASMLCEPEANAWSGLLCSVAAEPMGTRNWARGRLRSSQILRRRAYVLLSNSYAWGGRWVDAMKTRDVMSRKGSRRVGVAVGWS
ncbi:hypothetical protein SASPL_149594 [Salvia splendens]|uniref:Pentatricopeptide repeat-containing protein n=1 Tax=Salvia splendens TaxID=180675 RepID=A0A8X8WCH2_SALSN|nr:hypothetical protein SASPL_149594 [Salvia splendens]